MDRKDLLDRLNALLPARLDEIIFRLGVPPELLTGTAQTMRSIEVIRYQEGQNRHPELAKLLAQPGDRAAAPAEAPRPGPPLASRPLGELVDEVEGLLIQRARQVADDVKRGALTVAIDGLVAEVKRRGRVKEGDVVAGTQFLKVIGTGNFGTIYLGRRETDGVSLATKVFHLDKITEGMMLWSFRRSIKAMRHLNADKSAPSSIVRIHEAAADTLAFSMDYLSGGNLEDIASRGWTSPSSPWPAGAWGPRCSPPRSSWKMATTRPSAPTSTAWAACSVTCSSSAPPGTRLKLIPSSPTSLPVPPP